MFKTVSKVATGLALDVSKSNIIKAVGDFQYGALMAAGADKIIYNLRSLAAARPNHVFVATDIKNAFGAVLRHKPLQALLKHSPQLAPIMSLFWKQTNTPLLIPRTTDCLAELLVTQGVFQGECLSTAVFCIFLRAIVDKFYMEISSLQLPQNFNSFRVI